MPLKDQAKHLKVYTRLTRDAAKEKPDLIVWPDSSLPAPIASSRLVRYAVGKLAYETGAFLLAGGAGQEKLGLRKEGYQPYSNSEFLISQSGRIEEQYNKIRLLPFNEYLPLQNTITWPRWITKVEESYLPGEEYTLFKVSDAIFGTPICWENMFSDFFRRFVKKGANFMVSTTNEGFFGPTAFPHQTLAMNIFRAVENRVAIARTTPTGVSCFISPDGKIVEKVQDMNGEDLFVSGFIVWDVPLSNKKTFYTVYGDIFAYISIGVAALIIMVSLWRKV
jgi:apolipoprotein N-acyltransferase